MQTNIKRQPLQTHEGAPARIVNAEFQLRRSMMSCMLWESEFYEDGQEIAKRIAELVGHVPADVVGKMAIEARHSMNLRHAPLWLCCALAKKGSLKADVLVQVIHRADEPAEFLAMYWKEARCPLSAQVKKGLAKAFRKWDSYQLSKYQGSTGDAVKLRDALFLCHAKPKDSAQEATWKALVEGTLAPPDTWESALVSGKNKKETFTRLLQEDKLGGMALLRNLRNMAEVGVDEALILGSLASMDANRILPFRFIAAARYAPQWEGAVEKALFRCLIEQPKLMGKTTILVDVSGSMDEKLSAKSDMNRIDAACGLAMIARELAESVSIYSFSSSLVRIPDRHGFALRDAINGSQSHASTYLGKAINGIPEDFDRLIVVTDEQSHDSVPNPTGKGYMINVASARNGVGYGPWIHVDGFSEAVLKWILSTEKEGTA